MVTRADDILYCSVDDHLLVVNISGYNIRITISTHDVSVKPMRCSSIKKDDVHFQHEDIEESAWLCGICRVMYQNTSDPQSRNFHGCWRNDFHRKLKLQLLTENEAIFVFQMWAHWLQNCPHTSWLHNPYDVLQPDKTGTRYINTRHEKYKSKY